LGNILINVNYQFHNVPSSSRATGRQGIVGVFCRQFFVKLDAKAWFVAWMHIAVIKAPAMREDFEHLL
jgi:hypothetical protein